jgi:hypothetical protein
MCNNLYTRVLPQVEVGDGLPTQVCNECVTHLNAALTFKEKCLTADSILRHLLNVAVSHAPFLSYVSSAQVVFIDCGIVYSSKRHKAVRNSKMRKQLHLI